MDTLQIKYCISQRWYIDGTVECFTGGHAALAVFAIIVLGLYTVIIVVVTAITMEKVEVMCVYDVCVCICMYIQE